MYMFWCAPDAYLDSASVKNKPSRPNVTEDSLLRVCIVDRKPAYVLVFLH